MRVLFAAAGIDFDQWKALTAVALKLDFRGSTLGRSPFRRRAGFAGGLIAQFMFYTMFGAAIALVVWFSRDLFLVGTIAMTYTMFAVGIAVLVDHNSALASPLDHGILGFRPVTSRTYFAVRLTNVLVYTMALTTLAAWLPVVSLFVRHGGAVGAAGIAAFYACSVSTALAILLGYAWMLHAVGADAVKRALSYVQLIMSFAVYGGYFLVTRAAVRRFAISFTLPKTAWLLLYPATWFGSYLELAAGKTGPLEIVPAAASVMVLAAMASSLGGRLSLDYAQRLGELQAATAHARPAGRARPTAGLWFRTGEARAVALLVRSQFRNDQRFRMGVLAVLPMTLVYLLMGLRDGPLHDPFVAQQGSRGFLPVMMAVVMFPSLLKMHLTRSDSYRASWIFFASPSRRMQVVRSSQNVLVAFFLLPYLLFLTALYTYFIGNVFHVAVHIGLQGLLGYLVLQVAMLADPALPFSRPPQKGRNSAATLIFVMVAAMASTVLNTFSAALYGSALATAGAFGAIGLASVVVDRLTRARVELETESLEFEG